MALNLLVIFAIPIFLLLMAGAIVLQVFLARNKHWWPGVIPPVISFVISIVLTATTVGLVSRTSVLFLILLNVPTVVLTVMYFALHKRADKISEIKKMNIQDLE